MTATAAPHRQGPAQLGQGCAAGDDHHEPACILHFRWSIGTCMHSLSSKCSYPAHLCCIATLRIMAAIAEWIRCSPPRTPSLPVTAWQSKHSTKRLLAGSSHLAACKAPGHAARLIATVADVQPMEGADVVDQQQAESTEARVQGTDGRHASQSGEQLHAVVALYLRDMHISRSHTALACILHGPSDGASAGRVRMLCTTFAFAAEHPTRCSRASAALIARLSATSEAGPSLHRCPSHHTTRRRPRRNTGTSEHSCCRSPLTVARRGAAER